MFDRIVLINLDKRTDRFGAFKAKIAPYPLLHDFIRYRAVHGDSVTVPGFFISGGGAWGCRQSHLRVLEDALMDGIEVLCVFEDDVRFVNNFEQRLKQFIKAVPDDWEGLMLGGQNHGPAQPVPTNSPDVFKSMNTQRTHAYVVRGKEPMQDLYRLWGRCDRHIDHWFGQWQQRFQVYQPASFLCGQDETSSDISGRRDTIRFWGTGNDIDAKDYPITLLVSERMVAELLRNAGFHFGNDRDKITGCDRGLTELELLSWPSDRFNAWAKIIVNEALERQDIPGIWHSPPPDPKVLQSRLKRKLEVVEAKTVEEAIRQMPKLLPNWKASKIIWCWRGSGMDLLEGLAYHGWHRGYWKDDVTGLDQGIRMHVEQSKYKNFKQLVRQLEREITHVKYGKILLAHPELDIDRVRDEIPGSEIYELIGNDINGILDSYEKILNQTLEMYREAPKK